VTGRRSSSGRGDAGRKASLDASIDMTPVEGEVEVEVPAAVLWEAFTHADLWPRWNRSFAWVRNRRLVLGDRLVWAFEPIRRRYLYRMPAVATIVELEPGARVTWEVTVFPGMYARHTYQVEPAGDDRSRFRSWEKAMGPGFRLLRRFWIAHFRFVRDRSLEGAHALERAYRDHGNLDLAALPRRQQ
jgi:hypothetical protein